MLKEAKEAIKLKTVVAASKAYETVKKPTVKKLGATATVLLVCFGYADRESDQVRAELRSQRESVEKIVDAKHQGVTERLDRIETQLDTIITILIGKDLKEDK